MNMDIEVRVRPGRVFGWNAEPVNGYHPLWRLTRRWACRAVRRHVARRRARDAKWESC